MSLVDNRNCPAQVLMGTDHPAQVLMGVDHPAQVPMGTDHSAQVIMGADYLAQVFMGMDYLPQKLPPQKSHAQVQEARGGGGTRRLSVPIQDTEHCPTVIKLLF